MGLLKPKSLMFLLCWISANQGESNTDFIKDLEIFQGLIYDVVMWQELLLLCLCKFD